MKVTVGGIIWLCIMGIICCFVYLKLEGAELDMDSFRLNLPANTCDGGQMEDLNLSVWACRLPVTYLEIGKVYSFYEEKPDPYEDEPLIYFEVLACQDGWCKYKQYHWMDGAYMFYVFSGREWRFRGLIKYTEVRNPQIPHYEIIIDPICIF